MAKSVFITYTIANSIEGFNPGILVRIQYARQEVVRIIISQPHRNQKHQKEKGKSALIFYRILFTLSIMGIVENRVTGEDITIVPFYREPNE